MPGKTYRMLQKQERVAAWVEKQRAKQKAKNRNGKGKGQGRTNA